METLILLSKELKYLYSTRQKDEFQLTDKGWIYPNSKLTQHLLVRDTLQIQLSEELEYKCNARIKESIIG